MKYSDYDNTQSMIPQPKLNGGLYTGESFKGPWGNVYVEPDTVYMTNVALLSANPPPHAPIQYGNTIRPGNNRPQLKHVHRFSDEHNIVCTGTVEKQPYKSMDPFFTPYTMV